MSDIGYKSIVCCERCLKGKSRYHSFCHDPMKKLHLVNMNEQL